MAKEKKKKSGCLGIAIVLIIIVAIIGGLDDHSNGGSETEEMPVKTVKTAQTPDADTPSPDVKQNREPEKPKIVSIKEIASDESLQPNLITLKEDQKIPLVMDGQQVGEQTIEAGSRVLLLGVNEDGTLTLGKSERQFDANYKATNLIEEATSLNVAIQTAKQKIRDDAVRAEEARRNPKTIPGIVASDVHLSLKERGFVIQRIWGEDGDLMYSCTDDRRGNTRYQADAIGKAGQELTSVRATVTSTPSEANVQGADFLGYIASLPYEGSLPNKASAWVESNIGRNATTEIGGVRFELSAISSTGRMLTITPAN